MWKLKAALALALLALAAQYVAGEKVEKDVTELQVGVKVGASSGQLMIVCVATLPTLPDA